MPPSPHLGGTPAYAGTGGGSSSSSSRQGYRIQPRLALLRRRSEGGLRSTGGLAGGLRPISSRVWSARRISLNCATAPLSNWRRLGLSGTALASEAQKASKALFSSIVIFLSGHPPAYARQRIPQRDLPVWIHENSKLAISSPFSAICASRPSREADHRLRFPVSGHLALRL